MSESVDGIPPSLRSADLAPLWTLVCTRLELRGTAWRGTVRRPELSSRGGQLLDSLLGRPGGGLISLADLEQALVVRRVGADLPAALAALGFPVSDVSARRRQERATWALARDAARSEATSWPESWAGEWIDQVIAAGILRRMEEDAARSLVRSVRAVLDELNREAGREPVSRTDLAARLLGSSHALDTGTRLEAAVSKALAQQLDAAGPRELWERAGAHTDLVSAPVLCWALRPTGSDAVASLAATALDAGLPLHLSQLALRSHPVSVAPGTSVLVVENPRLVEAASQRRLDRAVVCTNGNPSSTVALLLDQLASAGARLLYHGDFDAAGLGIASRMHARGLRPWHMDVGDYVSALDAAEQDGVELPSDDRPVPDTPWDPELARVFAERRLIVHEERLIGQLFQG